MTPTDEEQTAVWRTLESNNSDFKASISAILAVVLCRAYENAISPAIAAAAPAIAAKIAGIAAAQWDVVIGRTGIARP